MDRCALYHCALNAGGRILAPQTDLRTVTLSGMVHSPSLPTSRPPSSLPPSAYSFDLTKGAQDKDFSYSFFDSPSAYSLSLVLGATMKSKEFKTKVYSDAHSLILPPSLSSCVKETQDLKICSHAHSLIFSLVTRGASVDECC